MQSASRLQPFCHHGAPDLSLEAMARVIRTAEGPAQLALQFRLSSVSALRIPDPLPSPRRLDGLWQHTCLEAFVADPAGPGYWEFNLAPSGDWNAYHLSGYRTGLRQEAFYADLPLARSAAGQALVLDLRCPLPPGLQERPVLAVGLTAVLEDRSGSLSYWALCHPGAEPDFHDSRGWTLRL